MSKLKLKFHCGETEVIVEEEFKEDWTYTDVEESLDKWLSETFDVGWEILEMNGKPYTGE